MCFYSGTLQQYLLTLIGITLAGVGVSSASYMTKPMQEQISREPAQRPVSSRVNISRFGKKEANYDRSDACSTHRSA